MRHRSRVRATVWIAGLALAAVVALAIAEQDQLAMRYHLFRLRDEPQLLARLCEASEKSPEGRAARAFLKEPAGARELVRWFIQELDLRSENWIVESMTDNDGQDPSPEDLASLRHVDRALFAHLRGPGPVRGSGGSHLELLDWGDGRSDRGKTLDDGTKICASDFLVDVAGREIELPEFSGLRFKAVAAEEARPSFAESRMPSDLPFLSFKEQFVLLAYKPGKLVPPRRRPTSLFPPLPTLLKKL